MEQLVHALVRHEFELYLLMDHNQAIRILKKFPDSILFINIDEGLKEPEWEDYVRNLMSSPDTKEVRIGILSYNEDRALAEKYLMELAVPCGFIGLKLGLMESTQIILKTLATNEARGRRKHVRATCKDPNQATFNVKVDNKVRDGNIVDISAAGMACTFKEDFQPKVGTHFTDIQLRLQGKLCMVAGRVAGFHREQKNHYVFMFDPDMTDSTKDKIYSCIHRTLQDYIAQI
ncbi:MAG TPA: PilZ domain-containing protein [Spirochaetales bacterium]|nr:PilZ domain-containing protein [Spirochaetales bacterium]